MEDIPEENNILYHITYDQARILAEHFGLELDDLEEYEIAELLDKYIDELA